jgi:hypothetical protein
MYRYSLELPDDLADMLKLCALHLSVARGERVPLVAVIIELLTRGLEAVKDEPGWKDALQKK